ncbi:allantoicase [Actinomadura livida]|uniref:Probable allantoicase n=1 Tax=Actinomadura livida TaxID=79909 RepID=A0A7W7IH90_9ACTN|nr:MULTISPECIES: allantoicase [Actinomadura]MBB4777071.1 allantoicase [Actinomadura catellatispora]GGU37114.1 putative allantoicase [Actinomadura livida]
MSDFTSLPDLAVRTLGGSVIAASDESFAEKENLLNPWAPAFSPETFGPKGQLYDGWETARRRGPGHDWALVRLGLPGVVRGVVIDTAWFRGNFPPHASVEACAVDGHPADLTGADWVEILPKSPLKGDSAHAFAVDEERLFTHVRLNMFPDGGIARLRVHGEVVADPRLLTGLTVDLAALENGARVVECSDMFYSSPDNMLFPGLARNQAEGWETARRRDGGNDWAVIRLAAPGTIRLAEIDTTNLKFNAPAQAALSGMDARVGDTWSRLLPRTDLLPDTRHRFRLTTPEVTHVRLDIHPDGGIARLRLLGDLAPDAERALTARWDRLRGA